MRRFPKPPLVELGDALARCGARARIVGVCGGPWRWHCQDMGDGWWVELTHDPAGGRLQFVCALWVQDGVVVDGRWLEDAVRVSAVPSRARWLPLTAA